MDLHELERFLLAARERTCLGQGHRLPPERSGAVEIVYREGGLTYRDSYFGQSRLVGQEVVRRAGLVVWAMSYLITIEALPPVGEELAPFLQRAQQARYRERRLLGPYEFTERTMYYEDRNDGGLDLFQGETVVTYRPWGNESPSRTNDIRGAQSRPVPEALPQQQVVFRMPYCGGLVR
jgi:hypothetical protein